MQLQLQNGSAYVPAGTPRHAIGAVELVSSGGGTFPCKQFTRAQHGMHDDRELASDGNCRTLEADLLAQLLIPSAKIAVSVAAGENDDGCFVQQNVPLLVPAHSRH